MQNEILQAYKKIPWPLVILIMIPATALCVLCPPLLIFINGLAAWLDLRNDSYLATGLLMLTAAGTAFAAVGTAGLSLAAAALPAIVTVVFIRKGLRLLDGLTYASAAAVAAVMIITVAAFYATDFKPVDALTGKFAQWVNTTPRGGVVDYIMAYTTAYYEAGNYRELLQLVRSYSVGPRDVLITQSMKYLGEAIAVNAPSILMTNALMAGLFSWMAPHYALTYRKEKNRPMPDGLSGMAVPSPYAKLVFPRWMAFPMIILVLGGFLLTFFAKESYLQIAALTLSSITDLIFACIGMCLVAFWFGRAGMKRTWQTVIICAVFFLGGRTLFVIAGWIEFIFNIRRVILLKDQMRNQNGPGQNGTPPTGGPKL